MATGKMVEDMEAVVGRMRNQSAEWAFLQRKQFLAVAQRRETDVEGAKSVVFTIYESISAPSAELSETSDAITPGVTQQEVALREYGNVVLSCERLRREAFGAAEREQSTLMGFSAGETLESVAREALDRAGSPLKSVGGMTPGVLAERSAVLAARGVPPLEGGYYVAFMHSSIAKQLESCMHPTPGSVIRIPGEVGESGGVRIVVTNHVIQLRNEGYVTYILGFQALALATVEGKPLPEISIREGNPDAGEVVARLSSVGWYALCGIEVLRDEAIMKVVSEG